MAIAMHLADDVVHYFHKLTCQTQAGGQDQRGATIMKSFITVFLVTLGLTGQPVFADLSPAVCGDIAAADPKPKPDEDEAEPDCD